METHTVLGEAMLSGVVFLKGEGLKIVRSTTSVGMVAVIRTGSFATRFRSGLASSPSRTHSTP